MTSDPDLIQTIFSKLDEMFNPTSLEVLNESDQHAGHSGWREGQVTHVRVRMISEAFAGDSRVTIHRKVNAALAEAFAQGLHALAVEARAG